MKVRALRRHHEQRMKQRVGSYYAGIARGDARQCGKLAQARTPCSCHACGNPRRQWRTATVQERRAGAWDGARRQAAV
jgi:hypothetical protein